MCNTQRSNPLKCLIIVLESPPTRYDRSSTRLIPSMRWNSHRAGNSIPMPSSEISITNIDRFHAVRSRAAFLNHLPRYRLLHYLLRSIHFISHRDSDRQSSTWSVRFCVLLESAARLPAVSNYQTNRWVKVDRKISLETPLRRSRTSSLACWGRILERWYASWWVPLMKMEIYSSVTFTVIIEGSVPVLFLEFVCLQICVYGSHQAQQSECKYFCLLCCDWNFRTN